MKSFLSNLVKSEESVKQFEAEYAKNIGLKQKSEETPKFIFGLQNAKK